MYHFLSGYTRKLAGTERGVTSPEATFSTCSERHSYHYQLTATLKC